jgi:hypothetical protein
MGDSHMSFSTIYIHRSYPIKNGFVQVPPVLETDKTTLDVEAALAAYPGSAVKQLTNGSGNCTGAKFVSQQFLSLAPVLANPS